ncbi:hypothetical protein [Actinomadura algeriensis]|uniref:Tetratricopeptide repeat protein n=1 Tax=Actinomadura algeriensis TaxID=1679523 RepID=A0ABR9JN26_9ACTN|nr:hypothetical protein [Actinomadura algeriensis]MBE1531966.1 hypothetical protein [Actinomadura algeriensis]
MERWCPRLGEDHGRIPKVADWVRHVRELTRTGRSGDVLDVLEGAAGTDPDAARELGHLLLRTSWLGDGAERWLRRAVAARPDDAEAALLLATALATRCGRIAGTPGRPCGDAGALAAEACGLYRTVLRLDPGSGAAASGLALLLGETVVTGPDVPDAAAAARRALEIDPDEPVALAVLADRTGDERVRERADAFAPPIPSARWGAGTSVSPFGHGKPGRYDFFVVEVAVEVTDRGETATGFAVLRDVEQLRTFEACSSPPGRATAYRYERGVLVAKHTASRLSGRTFGEVAEGAGEPLPVGHPVRHDGEPLRYGANGLERPDEPL